MKSLYLIRNNWDDQFALSANKRLRTAERHSSVCIFMNDKVDT